MKINLDNTQRVVAEKIVVAGKVPLLERDNEDLKIKMKRYEENTNKILEELSATVNEKNKLLNKVEDMMKNPQIVAGGAKSRTGISIRGGTRSGLGTVESGPINHGIIFFLFVFFLPFKKNFILFN